MRIFRFIAAKKTEHSIQIMCRVLEVSRSGYHAWAVREPSAHAVADQALTPVSRWVVCSFGLLGFIALSLGLEGSRSGQGEPHELVDRGDG